MQVTIQLGSVVYLAFLDGLGLLEARNSQSQNEVSRKFSWTSKNFKLAIFEKGSISEYWEKRGSFGKFSTGLEMA